MPTIRKALIVGGGIAGLTAATTLGRRGVACDVVELRDEPAGAAITIQNRAINALSELGLLDQLLEAGAVHPQRDIFRYLDARGEVIPTPPMPPEPESGLPSAVAIHRVELARILRAAAEEAGAVIYNATTVKELVQNDDSATVTLSDGTTKDYDLVIASDGVRSATRSMVFGDSVQPQYTGTTMFRWIIPGVPDLGPTGFYQASNLVVLVRLRDGSIYLATGRDYDQPPRFTQEEARHVVRENLEQFDAPLTRELLKRLDDNSHIVINDYHWLMLPAPWFKGRVLAVGDAAHATTAHLSSGGAMAIEDAVVLGEEIDAGGNVEDILYRFMNRRFERTNLVVSTSVELGEMLKRGAPAPEQNALRARALGALRAPF
ncbi:FAD-dependent monooxygenase [Pseudarthrobacter sp. SL88]|uniref:FAD-dependent oxidoreductase n=1 Tax=Pseudarthrobacter sp. SL88 TaxID=2994666 RepID=UPI0022733D4A|nr:FAD-dependent oxidoreductase [Pseudarthrobacter sp. SL88]MCY1674949.1 FAD-dependent monooxygenase [Pseudarthrobacter sp. SL88]